MAYIALRWYAIDPPTRVYAVASFAGTIGATIGTDRRISSEILFTTLLMSCALLSDYYRSLFPNDFLDPKRLVAVVFATLGMAALICQLVASDPGKAGSFFFQLSFICSWIAMTLACHLSVVYGGLLRRQMSDL